MAGQTLKQMIARSVPQCSGVGVKLMARVAAGQLKDIDGVLGTLRACEMNAGKSRHVFAALIGNVLCNLSNWPGEMASLKDHIGLPPIGRYFVPFANGGFCRKLKDDPNTDVGNLPHHMLSYFVMATFYAADMINVGVLVHEIDGAVSSRGNPEFAADYRSGTLAARMAQSMTGDICNWMPKQVAGFTDRYEANCRAGRCGCCQA